MIIMENSLFYQYQMKKLEILDQPRKTMTSLDKSSEYEEMSTIHCASPTAINKTFFSQIQNLKDELETASDTDYLSFQ